MHRTHSLRLRDKASLLVLAAAIVISGLVAAAAIAETDAAAIASATAARSVQVRLAEYGLALSNQRAAMQAYLLAPTPGRLDEFQADRNTAIIGEGRLAAQAGANHVAIAGVLVTADAWRAWADAAVGRSPAQPASADLDRERDLYAAVQGQQRTLDRSLDAAAVTAATGAWRFPILAIALPVVGGLVLAMLVVIWWRINASVLQPIDRLAGTARAISAGGSPPTPCLERRDELGDLARALAGWRTEAERRVELARAMAEEQERQVHMLELLNGTATEVIAGILEPSTLARTLVDRAGDLVGGAYALLAVRGIEREALAVVAHRGEPRRPAAFPLDENGALVRVFRSGQALVIGDYPAWPGASPRGRGAGVTSLAAAPLVIGDRRTGVLAAYTRDGRSLTERDLGLLTLLAAQAAPALEAARLHAELAGANAELAQASRHKSEFLASMSHELRTPLNAMLGFTELVLDYGDDLEPARRTHFMRHVHSSGRHLLALINDVLDLARVESGRLELRPATFDLAAVVASSLASMEPLAARAGVELVARCPGPLQVEADEDKVRQILLNLLSNAVKFTPEGGTVTVEGRRDGGWIALCVSDTGVGIAEEDKERIFEAFQQVGANEGRGGTGLGLALTRRLAELHSGRVTVESQPGRGSRFCVELPASQRIEALVEAAQPADGPLVLVVEDAAGAAALLVETLRREGYRTEVLRDGRRVVQAAARLQPFAITLDVLMPGLDGWEVLRELKRSDRTRSVPVLVVSVTDERHRARSLGAADALVKPLDRDALRAAIARLSPTPL